ncbi:Flagellar protein export ATPase FliI OS=Lysinibacillus sphaericus OX=1421 GN=LS41612_17825 PE=4 SV=1 [Lysinibacillus sphaericus]
MNHVAEPAHKKAAERLRELYYTYDKSEDLINIGAYKRGTSKEIDEAIYYEPLITAYLKQGYLDKVTLEESMNELITLSNGGGK